MPAAVAAAATEAPALEASAVRSAATAATTTLAADSLRLAPSEADTEVVPALVAVIKEVATSAEATLPLLRPRPLATAHPALEADLSEAAPSEAALLEADTLHLLP
jgi:hypothetical protein